MKSERGITLTSLIVYIISMLIVISIVSVLTTYFYKNIKNINYGINPLNEYTRFTSYFSNEVNTENIKILECEQNDNQSYIVFDNGVQYTFVRQNEGIYHNNAKICSSVKECTFSTGITNGNETVTVNLKIEDKTYNNTYILKK